MRRGSRRRAQGGAADPGWVPEVIELADEVPWRSDQFVFSRWEEAERLARGRLVDRERPGFDAAVRNVERTLDASQVLALRWRARFGWPVTPGRSLTQLRSSHPVSDALMVLADGLHIADAGSTVEVAPLVAARTRPRERAVATVRCRLPWSPPFTAQLSVGEWSNERCRLSLEIRPALRAHWPRRWFTVAHDALSVMDRTVAEKGADRRGGGLPAGQLCRL